MNYNFYLVHGGPGSGRYPLGSGDRPYQKLEGSRRKTSGGILSYIKSKKAKKPENVQKPMTEEERKRQYEAEKERVLKRGTASEIMRYQGELTNQELQNAVTRLNLETQLINLSKNEIQTKMDKIDSVMKTVKTGNEWAKIGTDTYNTFAKIYNATPEGKEKPLTIIGESKKTNK